MRDHRGDSVGRLGRRRAGENTRVLTVVAMAEDDGRESWRARIPDLPEWAWPGLEDSAEFTLTAAARRGALAVGGPR